MAQPSELLTVAIREEGDLALLVLDGECDMHSAPTLADSVDKVLAADPSRVEIDAAELRFAGSAALKTLLLARQRACALGAELYVVRPSEAVDRLLKMTGLDELLVARDAHGAHGAHNA